jgi:hypothetical protein
MGNITFTFTNAQGTLSYPYNVSDADLDRLITYLRNKHGTIQGAAPDPVTVTPATIPVALQKATGEVMKQWKSSTLEFEKQQEIDNISIPPIDVTEG